MHQEGKSHRSLESLVRRRYTEDLNPYRIFRVVVAVAAASHSLRAQEEVTPAVVVTRASGGSIRTPLGLGIVLDKDSSLVREWIAIHQAALPVRLLNTPGITTTYENGGQYSRGAYEYSAKFSIEVNEPVTAVEIRFLTFDVWGGHSRTLTMTEVRDFAKGTTALQGTWSLYSENEASEFYASIAYVARVRTADGRVITADIAPVLEEARKFSAKFSEGDLDPDKPGKPGK